MGINIRNQPGRVTWQNEPNGLPEARSTPRVETILANSVVML